MKKKLIFLRIVQLDAKVRSILVFVLLRSPDKRSLGRFPLSFSFLFVIIDVSPKLRMASSAVLSIKEVKNRWPYDIRTEKSISRMTF